MKMAALILSVSCGLMLVAFSARGLPGQTKRDQDSAVPIISPESRFVTVNGIRLHYLEWGQKGPHILLLHGMNGDARVWSSLAPILATDYHVVAPDRRGAGESGKPEQGYNYQTLVEDVALLAGHLKLKPVSVVGHSFGAQLALMVGAMKPGLANSVIMIDGGFWPKRSTPDNAATSSEIEKTIRDYDPETVYPKISVPVLMVIARGSGPGADVIAQLKEKGIDFFEEVRKAERGAKELADRKLIHGEIATIENTGHNVQVDQPQKLAGAIKQFLSKAGFVRR